MPLKSAKRQLATVLISLFVMSSACAFDCGLNPSSSLKPLPLGDVDRARHALAKIVGRKSSSTYSVAESDCYPFESCSDVVRREIVFEQRPDSINASIYDINRVYCTGTKLEPWSCSGPERFARFSAFEGVYDVQLEGDISLARASGLMDYLWSTCYKVALEEFPRVRHLAGLEIHRMPTKMDELSLGRYLVHIAENRCLGIFVALTIEDDLSLPSECPYRLINANNVLIKP